MTVAPLALAHAADAQKAPAKAAAWIGPKNTFGQPDLQGYWSNATLTPQARRPLAPQRGAAAGGRARPRVVRPHGGAADVPKQLQQQQLADRADQARRRDAGRDGARPPHRPAERQAPH